MKNFSISLVAALMVLFTAQSYAQDDDFRPAYQNMEAYEAEDSNKFFVRHQGRNYYTSGREDGFRVNENNEESTDETVGIITFLLAPISIIYMNFIGWWE
jgi:hypothetical protein